MLSFSVEVLKHLEKTEMVIIKLYINIEAVIIFNPNLLDKLYKEVFKILLEYSKFINNSILCLFYESVQIDSFRIILSFLKNEDIIHNLFLQFT